VAMAKAYIVQAIERIRHSEEAIERGIPPTSSGSAKRLSSYSSRPPSGS